MWHLLSGDLDVDIQADIETEATWHVRASLSSLGAITQMWQRPSVRFEVPTSRDTHSDTQLHTRPDEKHRPVAGEKFQLCDSHTTALWIIELSRSSWSTLCCAHRESLTCQTHQYTWLEDFFLHAPETQADGTLRGAPQFISSCEASTCLYPSQIRQRMP